MDGRPHVALIGMMGSGKSTVGFWLARMEGLRFVDLDAAIEEHQGRSVVEIFEAGGETLFRDVEQELLADFLASPQPLLLSCGGGAVLRAENRAVLRTRAWVCWLRAGIETLGRRVRTGTNRPLLGEDPTTDLIEINQARAELYAETAHTVIDVDNMNTSQVAERIRLVRPRHTTSR